MPYQARRIAFNINIPKELVNQAVKFMMDYIMHTSKRIAPLLKSTL